MNEADIVLQVIYEELAAEDADVVGGLALYEDCLVLRDGDVSVRATVLQDPGHNPRMAHCHVIADVGRDRSGVLDACVVGLGDDRRASLVDAASAWTELVAPPILSLVNGRTVMGAGHFDGTDTYGVAGCHGFVGPMRFRGLGPPLDESDFENIRVFDYASEMAPPGMLHLVKVTLSAEGNGPWNRSLEVDGHMACYADKPWKYGPPERREYVVCTGFALFHYGDRLHCIEQRQALDDTIRRFVEAARDHEDLEEAVQQLKREGVDAELAQRVRDFAPLAFARVLLEATGIAFEPEYIRITRAGELIEGLHLMHEPVYARSFILSHEYHEGELAETFQQIAATSPYVQAMSNAFNAGAQPEDVRMSGTIIPESGVSDDVFDQALAELQSRLPQERASRRPTKPWWKFW